MNKQFLFAAFIFCLPVALHAQTDPNTLYAVIEIGASGIKGVVMETVPPNVDPESPPVKAVKQFEPLNKNAYSADSSKTGQVGEAVAQLHKQMRDELHVPDNHVYLVGSSGLPPEVREAVGNTTFDEGSIEFITAEKESSLEFLGIVPARRFSQVVVLDIGSGNSKGGYQKKGKPAPEYATFAVPWGCKTYAAAVNKERKEASFLATANSLREKLLLTPLREEIAKCPGMRERKRLYLAGGIMWAMATLLHPDQIGPDAKGYEASFIKLSTQDIAGFCGMMMVNPNSLLNPDLGAVRPENRQKAAEETARVAKVFNPDQLAAGAMILKCFMDQMNYDKKEAIFFSRRALYAWPQGYLLEKLAAKG